MQCPSWTALVAVLILALKRSADAATPNVVLVVVDDLGWTNVGWHSPTDPNVITPHMDALVRDGIELDRMYAYKYCSPTRSSILSGRLPVHVTQYCNYESVYSVLCCILVRAWRSVYSWCKVLEWMSLLSIVANSFTKLKIVLVTFFFSCIICHVIICFGWTWCTTLVQVPVLLPEWHSLVND